MSNLDEEEARETAFYRLEMLGYRVGLGVVERYVLFLYSSPLYSGRIRGLEAMGYKMKDGYITGGFDTTPAGPGHIECNCDQSHKSNPIFPRFSRDKPRFTDSLDVIKFLCKDLWTLVFRKQIDNLKTNHRVRSFLPKSPSL
ncbi:hypothetical protein M501DRAFT_1000676 [Patellaria atrata CBS 101060]|uniref:Uncharacterized protein n=1 Tax=Patellaria atrata CBS 101060 TaxID=1346257 RepID=A0A9P4VVA5_9PEZI|nr:hypothetical protein M501DRAFT_1000676 [Patellaria atrata CBS 101060]